MLKNILGIGFLSLLFSSTLFAEQLLVVTSNDSYLRDAPNKTKTSISKKITLGDVFKVDVIGKEWIRTKDGKFVNKTVAKVVDDKDFFTVKLLKKETLMDNPKMTKGTMVKNVLKDSEFSAIATVKNYIVLEDGFLVKRKSVKIVPNQKRNVKIIVDTVTTSEQIERVEDKIEFAKTLKYHQNAIVRLIDMKETVEINKRDIGYLKLETGVLKANMQTQVTIEEIKKMKEAITTLQKDANEKDVELRELTEEVKSLKAQINSLSKK